MNSSSTNQIEALRAVGRQRGYSEDEINQRLAQAGLIQGPSLGQQLLHGAGIAGRALAQGAAAAEQMNPFSAPMRMTAPLATGQPSPTPAQQADQVGLPQPQNAGERLAVSAGEGATQAMLTPGAGLGQVALSGAAQMAGQGAAENGAGPLGQMAASLAVGGVLPVVGGIVAGGIRALLRGVGQNQAASEQAAALMQAGNPDAAYSLGQVAKGGIGSVSQGVMKNVPGATEVLRKSAAKQAAQMGQRATEIADAMSPGATVDYAGAALQRGIENGYLPRFRAEASRLYDAAYSMVPPDTRVQLPNTANLIAEATKVGENAPESLRGLLANPTLGDYMSGLADAIEQAPDGAVRMDVLRQLRTRLSDVIDGQEVLPKAVNIAALQKLRNAVSDDIGGAIAAAGPDAATAWNQADKFYQNGIDKITRIIGPLYQKNTPQQAFAALMSGSKQGASVLQTTMRGLDQESRGVIQAALVKELGRKGDEFSPIQFLRRFTDMTPEARAAVFTGAEPDQIKNLNDLAAKAKLIQDQANVLPNNSGTAVNRAWWGILSMLGGGALAGNPAMLKAGAAQAALSGGANIAARIFTNPRMIRAIVRSTNVPVRPVAQELLLLGKDAQKWPAGDKRLAQDVIDYMSNFDTSKIPLMQAVLNASGGTQ